MKPTVAGVCASVRAHAPLVPLVSVLLAAPLAAAAQVRIEGPPPAAGAAAPAAPPVDTLARALERVAWNEETAGPLLALDAQNVRQWQPAPGPNAPQEERFRQPRPLPPPANDRPYRMNVVAPFFGRKVVLLDTLTVLAPAIMIVLNDRPGRGDPLAGMQRSERMRYFAGSLSRDQWRRLASVQGLGAGDLDPDQRALFLSLLPDPFRLQKIKDEPNGGQRYLEDGKVTLTPGQRAQVRLRVNRSLQLSYPVAGRSNSYVGFGGPPRAAASDEDGERFIVEHSSDYGNRPDAYGETLRRELPSRLKTGQLAFDAPALQAAVSLLPPGGDGDNAAAKPLTVAELLHRVSKAVSLEIVADRRVAALSVWSRGESARASDVLRALCWAVTGTFRKVGPVYLLTDDVEGIETRRARIADWTRDVNARGDKQRVALDKRVREMQPGKFMDFAPGDPFALDANTLKSLQERRRAPGKPSDPDPSEMPLADLPPALAQFSRDQVAQHQRNGISETLRTDRVRVEVQTRVSYLVPEAGALEANDMHLYNVPALPEDNPNTSPAPTEPPPFTFPASMAARILYVAPASADEVRTAAQAARAHNLTHLWVDVPDDEASGKTLLTAAVQAGRAQGLSVFGVVRLLRRPLSLAPTVPADEDAAPAAAPPDSDDDLLDLNVQGETGAAWGRRRLRSADSQEPWIRAMLSRKVGDWLRPDAPATFDRLKTRLLALADTPSLTGLVLTGLTAPGYTQPDKADNFGWVIGAESDFGYTLANRLAFLRQESVDPVDFVGSSSHVNNIDLNLPFFSENAFQPRYVEVDNGWMEEPGVRSFMHKWAAFRHQQNVALLNRVRETLRTAFPNLALVLRSQPEGEFESWFGTWDKPGVPPPLVGFDYSPAGGAKFAQTAHTFSRRAFYNAPFYDFPVPGPQIEARKMYAEMLGSVMERHKNANWDGIVLDLSSGPLDKMLPALAALDPKP